MGLPGSGSLWLLELFHYIQKGRHIVVCHFLEGNINEGKCVQCAETAFAYQFELNHQQIFLQLGLLISLDIFVPNILLSLLEGLFLVENAVFKVGLCESSVNLVDFCNLNVLRNDPVLLKGGFSLLLQVLLSSLSWTHLARTSFFTTVAAIV